MGEKTGKKGQEHRYQRFLQLNAAAFPVPLPLRIRKAQFIYFDQDWGPHLLAPGVGGRRVIQDKFRKGEQAVLWRALAALNEEFLRVTTPAFVRLAAMLAIVIVIYPLFGLLI